MFGNTLNSPVIKSIFVLFMVFLASPGYTCMRAAVDVSVDIPTEKILIDNENQLTNRFGEIHSIFQSKYNIKTEQEGECLRLAVLAAEIKYDFKIMIDSRYKPGSCEYDAILGHETDHMRTYQSILYDYKERLKSALKNAAARVPAKSNSLGAESTAIDGMVEMIKSDPELELLLREMELEANLRNRKVDLGFDYMNNCK